MILRPPRSTLFPTRRSSDLIVMLPGIAAYVLHKNGGLQREMAAGGKFNADNAYSAVLGYLPHGLIGLSLAALTAADRKSTRLNSSHMSISYAVFCLKKKKII